jgi:hypothetical protein
MVLEEFEDLGPDRRLEDLVAPGESRTQAGLCVIGGLGDIRGHWSLSFVIVWIGLAVIVKALVVARDVGNIGAIRRGG